MAKKESKKKITNNPLNDTIGVVPPTGAVPPSGAVPPTMGIPPTGASIPTMNMPQTTPGGKKGKKNKKTGKNKKLSQNAIDTSQLTPEQLAQLQLEEAIKESTDPSSKLKKLKSPLSAGGCVLNILLLIVLTLLIVFFICWIMVDKFNPLVLAKDMLDQFGITQFFVNIGNWFKNLFGGNSEIIEMIKLFL